METLSSYTGDENNCLGSIEEEEEEDSEEEKVEEEDGQEADKEEQRKGETNAAGLTLEPHRPQWDLHVEIKASDGL